VSTFHPLFLFFPVCLPFYHAPTTAFSFSLFFVVKHASPAVYPYFFPSKSCFPDSLFVLVGTLRKLKKDHTFSDGTTVPKGVIVGVAVHQTHEDEVGFFLRIHHLVYTHNPSPFIHPLLTSQSTDDLIFIITSRASTAPLASHSKASVSRIRKILDRRMRKL
jgi:hypothetical protein